MEYNGPLTEPHAEACSGLPWAACDPRDMMTMNLEGLEMIAVLVVVVLFVKVLEQFGLLEAGYDGKERLLGLLVSLGYLLQIRLFVAAD